MRLCVLRTMPGVLIVTLKMHLFINGVPTLYQALGWALSTQR